MHTRDSDLPHTFKNLDQKTCLLCRGKAPALPLEPLPQLQNEKTNLKSLNLTADKDQHVWGMRSNLVLTALATTMVIGVIMLVATAMLQPE